MIILNSVIIFSGCEGIYTQSPEIISNTKKTKLNKASSTNLSHNAHNNKASSTNLSDNDLNNLNTSIYSETFITDPYQEKQNKQVDIMFIVDRSKSMSQEMQKAKDNLFNLFNQLKSQASTKIALMTKIGSGNFEMQPPADIPITTIDKNVQSYYLPIFARNYLKYTHYPLTQASNSPNTSPPNNQLFFREDSIKVFVVVSDEDTRNIYIPKFISAIKDYLDPTLESTMFFGFLHLTHIKRVIDELNIASDVTIHPAVNSQCGELELTNDKINRIPFVHNDYHGNPTAYSLCSPSSNNICTYPENYQGMIGINYYQMLSSNNFLDKGLYDICEQNWKLNFANIADNVIAQFNPVRSFLLQKNAISITSVIVNDQNVDQSKYSLENNRLVFVEEFLEIDHEQTIKVDYTITTNNQ